MRRTDENRAENYIKKHNKHRKWLVFVLCLSLFTGSGTLYMLNKPATAMTEEGAKSIGLVLDTADAEFEEGLIRQMEEEEASREEAASGSEDSSAAEESSNSGDKESGAAENGADKKEESVTSESTEDKKEESETGEVTEGKKEESETGEVTEDKEDESEDKENSEDKESAKTKETTEDKESDNKKADKKSDVVITVRYEDKAGEEIAEAKELSISESFDLKEEVRSFEGYLFAKGFIDDEEVTSIVKKSYSEMPDFEALKADAKEESKEDTKEEDTKSEFTYYEATLTNGDILVVDEDADLHLVYLKQNEKEEFLFTSDEYNVKVKLSEPSALPEGVELKVTTVDQDTEGYNYEAYMEALNENADRIKETNEEDKPQTESDEELTYDSTNTLLLDIAFMLEDVEYEPKEGSALVEVTFNRKQISEEIEAETSDELAIVHLPVNSEVMELVNSTSEATDISASDVEVQVYKEGTVSLDGNVDVISFETDAFSISAVVKKSHDVGDCSWEALTKKSYSAVDIIDALGDAKYFGAVANSFGGGSHFEANVAVNNYWATSGEVLFDYDNTNGGYILSDEFKNYKITVEKKSTSPDNFYFGVYEDEEGKNRINWLDFSFTSSDFVYSEGMYVATHVINVNNYPSLYVYELQGCDDEGRGGRPVKNNQTAENYTVSYLSNITETNNALDPIMSSYITNGDSSWNAGYYLHKNASLYYNATDQGWSKVSKDNNGNVYVSPEKYHVRKDYVDSMLTSAKELSAKLPYISGSSSVEVFNVKHKQWGEFRNDLFNAAKAANKKYSWGDQNDVEKENQGIKLGSDSILVINLDLTGCSDYTLSRFSVNGVLSTKAYEHFGSIASRIIINPVQKNSAGVYEPYNGTIRTSGSMGTLLAPSATVEQGGHVGAIIADYINNTSGEIHKQTLVGYKEATGKVTVTNIGKDNPKGKVVKEWNGKQAYPYIYAYVCARGYLNGKGIEDIPELGNLITLSGENHWTQEVSFPADTYVNKKGTKLDVIYRVVEVNAFKNGVNADKGLYTYDELKAKLEKGETTNDAGTSLFLYNDKSGNSITVNGYFTSYSSTIGTKTGYDGKERIIYIPGEKASERVVTITNNEDPSYAPTQLIVQKQWGDNDPGVGAVTFDIEITLLRKLEGEKDSKYVEVEKRTLEKGKESVGFTDLPSRNADGKKYVYSAKESYQGETFYLNGKSVNGFKLKKIEDFKVENGTGIRFINVPVIVIEKEFNLGGKTLTVEEAKAAKKETVFVNLYSGGNGIETKLVKKAIPLGSGNGWHEEIEAPRSWSSKKQYTYYIKECNSDGEEYSQSSLITYYAYENGKKTKSGTDPTGALVYGRNKSVLKLKVVNYQGTNVLPKTGGEGTTQYIAFGILLMAIAFSGFMLFKKREQL